MQRSDMDASLRKQASVELNETEDTREASVAALANWLGENPRLNLSSERRALLCFLRASKFNMQKSKKRMERWHDCSAKCAHIFTDRNPRLDRIVELHTSGFLAVPRERDQNNRLNLLINISSIPKDDDSFAHAQKTCFMAIDSILHDEVNQVSGFVCVANLDGYSRDLFTFSNFMRLKQNAELWHSGYPARLKAIYLINVPTTFRFAWAIIRPMLDNKLRKLVTMFSAEDAHMLFVDTGICKRTLPREYGGVGPALRDLSRQFYERLLLFYSTPRQLQSSWLHANKLVREN